MPMVGIFFHSSVFTPVNICDLYVAALDLVTVGTSEQLRGYSDIFIQASELRRFNDLDLTANRVVRVDNSSIPSFAMDYWTKLEEKRSVNITVRSFLTFLYSSMSNLTFLRNFSI